MVLPCLNVQLLYLHSQGNLSWLLFHDSLLFKRVTLLLMVIVQQRSQYNIFNLFGHLYKFFFAQLCVCSDIFDFELLFNS